MVPAGLDRGIDSFHFRVPPPRETERGFVLADNDTVVLSENPEEVEGEEEDEAILGEEEQGG